MEVEIRELPIPVFGGLSHSEVPITIHERLMLPELKIIINSAEKYYSENIDVFFFHEAIHQVLAELEGHETSEKFDNLFPTSYETRCLIDGNFSRHMIWRLRNNFTGALP